MLTDRIVLPGGAALDAANGIRGVKHTSAVNAGTDIAFGSACCDMIEAELWCPDGAQPIKQGDTVTYYKVNDSGARTKIGVFRCEKPTKSSANVYKVTAYDNMSRFEKDASAWLRGNQGVFPMTINTFVTVACKQCGVTLATTSLPRNGGYKVGAFYADNITWRQIIQWAAEAGGCFAHCNADGELAFGWYVENTTVGVAPGNGTADSTAQLADNTNALLLDSTGAQIIVAEATAAQVGYMAGSLTYEDYTVKAIDKLQISQSESDVGVIVPADGNLGDACYTIKGNLLLTTDSDAALRPVAQTLFDFARSTACAYFVPAKVSIPATLGIEAGQIINIQTPTGQLLRVFVMTATTAGQKTTLECTGNASRDSASAVNSQTYSNLTGKMLEIKTSVDGLNVKASELSGKYSEISQTVDGIKTTVDNNTGDISALTQTATTISAKVESNTGAISTLTQTATKISSEVSRKSHVFNNKSGTAGVPTPPYNVGDFYISPDIEDGKSGNSKTYICTTARAKGQAYNANDWARSDSAPTEQEYKSKITQLAGNIKLSTTSSDTEASITLSVDGQKDQTGTIKMKGLVSFENLSGSGTTTINGGNIKTGTIGNYSGSTTYNLDTGEIRSGTAGGERFVITPKSINWYTINDGQSFLTGVLHSVYGKTYIGANSAWNFFGWFDRGTPSFNYSSGGPNDDFCGIAITNTEGGLIHCNAAKFEIPGRIECSSLSVKGREI